MNMDFALVNRALLNIGMAPLTSADKQAGNEAWRTARDYFLETMLESLAQVEWTGAKRRRELSPARMPLRKHADFAYAYDLPIDCAKPIELDGQEFFKVEGALLYTDTTPARLLYVSNGRHLANQKEITGGNARRKRTSEYISGGDATRSRRYEWGDNVISGGNAKRKVPVPPADDYPDYREQRLEPNFYLYWENLLSSKYALRLTDKPDISMVYFQKAQAIGRAAEVVSLAGSAARKKAAETWQEELGLR